MSTHRKWVIGYFITFILMVITNYTAGQMGSDVGGTANENEALIQPAGFAFSIWGLIYALVFIWIIYLFFSKKDKSYITERLKFWPIANFILNGVWIFVFTQEWLFASIIVIAALLYTLAEIYTSISETNHGWFDRFPFAIYFAWVTLATIVNIFTWTTGNDIDTVLGMDELTWTIIVLIVAGLIGITIAIFFKDWVYPLVLIWPLFGIYAESGDVSTGLNITLLAVAAALVIIAVMVIVQQVKTFKRV